MHIYRQIVLLLADAPLYQKAPGTDIYCLPVWPVSRYTVYHWTKLILQRYQEDWTVCIQVNTGVYGTLSRDRMVLFIY